MLNSFVKGEKVFISLNAIMVMDFILLKEMIENNDEDYDIDFLIDKSDAHIMRFVMERKEKNIYKLLIKDESNLNKSSDEYYNEKILSVQPDNRIVTDFIVGMGRKYALTKNAYQKIVISMNDNFKHYNDFIKLFQDIFALCFEKTFVVDDKPETIKEYLDDESFNLIITDEEAILMECTDKLKHRVVLIPNLGYLFKYTNPYELAEIDQPMNVNVTNDILISKNKWELLASEYEFNLSFVNLFELTQEMWF